MAVSPQFRDFVHDQLSPHGGVRILAMFGGAGVYLDGLMIALIASDTLYFRVDDVSKPDFEAVGGTPFVYNAKGKPMVMSYWTVPENAFDDDDVMAVWVERARGAAGRVAAQKRRKKPPPAHKTG